MEMMQFPVPTHAAELLRLMEDARQEMREFTSIGALPQTEARTSPWEIIYRLNMAAFPL